MIDIDRLSKRFSGRTVVNDLSFRIDRGEIVGLLGPNGAGKSTTLKMLSGFLAPSAGSVRIFGFDMQDKARQAQKLIGYLPENAPSYGEMTVEGFLAFVASIRDYSGREKRRRIDSAMDCMELRDERRSIIETLSKGFKRRVALAQAILHDPELLLLDEPTDGLDPNQKHQVRQLVKNLSESKIVVISTHILEEVSFMCSRALVINGGRLLADNTPGELRTRSRYHHAVSLSIEAPVDPLAIAMLPGVAGIEGRPDRAGTLTILARPGAQILPALNRLIRQRLAGIRVAYRTRPTGRSVPPTDPRNPRMTAIGTIFRRELGSYFATPLAYVFTLIFLVLSGVATFYLGDFFERGQADLAPFFSSLPWLYLLLIPALAMRLWAEERKSGSIEMLMTLPVSRATLVTGKFLAAWFCAGLALLLTFPMPLTVNYLGSPDNGAIIAGYLAGWLLSGGYLAIGSCMSALAKNQIIAFALTVLVCLLFVGAGTPHVQQALSGWLPQWLLDGIASLSVLVRFEALGRGVLDVRDLAYFGSLIVAWLVATTIIIDLKKAA